MKPLSVTLSLICALLLSFTAAGQPSTCRCESSPEDLRVCILSACNTQNWSFFMKLCDPANVDFQKGIGMSEYQYVAEAMNLHTVNNSLKGDIAKKSTLDQVMSLSLEEIPEFCYWSPVITFTGMATLKDGSRLVVRVSASPRPSGGGYWITPALG